MNPKTYEYMTDKVKQYEIIQSRIDEIEATIDSMKRGGCYDFVGYLIERPYMAITVTFEHIKELLIDLANKRIEELKTEQRNL